MKLSRFARYAWVTLGYNILVVLWGAYVRATGSGAGCGAHWPLCGGVVIPQSPAVATLIEFSHRASSGLTLILVAGLVIWAFRAYPKGHLVRTGATLSGIFVVTEALVGAGLVLFQLVAHNASVARAFSVAVHLTNTFLLLAALTLTAHWATGGGRLRWRCQGNACWLLGVGLLGVLLLGVSGAVTALGDTLFPSGTLAEGIQQDFLPTAHFLIRLRVYHPILAVSVGVYIVIIGRVLNASRGDATTRRLGAALTGLVVIQLLAGATNVALMAPVWMQLLHLLLADLVWITLVLFAGHMLAQPAVSRHEQLAPTPPSQPIRPIRLP
jgi:heme A synthase